MTVFLYFLLLFIIINFFILGIFFSDIEIDVEKLNIESNEKKTFYIDIKKVDINVNLYIFKLIKIAKIKINENYINLFGKKIYIQDLYKKEKNKKFILNKIKNDYKNIDFGFLKPNLNKFNFKLELGTENAVITSFLTYIISTCLTYILKKSIKIFDPKKYNYKIIPIYSNTNYFSANLNSKIKIDTLNFISFIKQFNKSEISNDNLIKHKINNKYNEYGIVR